MKNEILILLLLATVFGYEECNGVSNETPLID